MPTMAGFTNPASLNILSIIILLKTISKNLSPAGSGFNVFCGSRIQPGHEEAMENLARYIIRASFSQERMTYIPNKQDELIPSILDLDGSSGEYKRNWARLIQKIYEVDPLTCPKCSGKMKVIPRVAG